MRRNKRSEKENQFSCVRTRGALKPICMHSDCISQSEWKAIKIYGHSEKTGKTSIPIIIIMIIFFFFKLIRHRVLLADLSLSLSRFRFRYVECFRKENDKLDPMHFSHRSKRKTNAKTISPSVSLTHSVTNSNLNNLLRRKSKVMPWHENNVLNN